MAVPARRLLGIMLAWIATAGVAWGLVGRPEHCTPITPDQAREAAETTVDWFEHNQLPDGRWVYRYNVDTDTVDRNPHLVRHSGVTMSLYQAHAAGIDGALATADAGTAWALDRLHRPDPAERPDDVALVALGSQAPSGGTALLVAGLAFRRLDTDDPGYDDELFAMGRALVAMTEPSGAVLETWDTRTEAPIPDRYSLFFTGEVYFALALLAQVDPDGAHGDWAGTAQRIGRYLAAERDDAEGLFPPTSDHWAAYGLASSAAAGIALDDDQGAYAERLAEIFSIQVRYESQRTGEGTSWLLRGPIALGAGVGTLGEGLGALWELTDDGGPLEHRRDAVGARLSCVAGVLYDRQVTRDEAQATPSPGLAEGAWFRLGWTQKDDQQHALSALLLAMPALAENDERPGPTGDDSVAYVLWLMVIAMALVNPVRVRRLLTPTSADRGRGRPSAVAVAGLGTFMGLAGVALVADAVLDAIDVSPPTAAIAAGLVIGLAAIVDFVRPEEEPLGDIHGRAALVVPLLIPGVLRPAAVVLTLAAAAHVSLGAGLAVAAATALCSMIGLRPSAPSAPTALETYGRRAAATLAAAGGIALMLNGIFAI